MQELEVCVYVVYSGIETYITQTYADINMYVY